MKEGIIKNALRYASRILPDKIYLKIRYYNKFHKKLNFNAPQSFNEKLQWLKIYDRNPLYTTLADKYAVRKYIANTIGEEYLIPLVGGPWNSFEEIDFESLPEQFVLKCNHDSGGLVICRDKSKLDKEQMRKKITNSIKSNYYWRGREWPYKGIEPKIIAEKYMKDYTNEVLPVYKFFCFNGEPMIVQTIQNDKQTNETIDYFDTNWNLLGLKQNYPNSESPYFKPKKFEQMLDIVKILSKNRIFIRVDLYSINNDVKFSEYTFYSDGGMAKFDPPEWDKKLGDLIILPEANTK